MKLEGDYWSGGSDIIPHFTDDFGWSTVSMGRCEKCGSPISVIDGAQEVTCSKCGWVWNFEKSLKKYEGDK